MRKYIVLIICGMLGVAAFGQEAKMPPSHHRGVPAYRGVIERVQPDGDTLHIYLRGDERQHYSMTLDGWQVIENQKGTLCYAVLCKDSTVVAGKKQAHDAEKRKCYEKRWLQRKGIKKEVILY